jgi:gliding motility-associated-like protein
MEKKQVSPIFPLLVFLFLLLVEAFPQNGTDCDYQRPQEADTWVFGKQSRLLFNVDPAQSSPTANTFSLPNGSASISKSNGNLLFFSNGIKVWNQGLYLMENGDDLKGNNFATQSALIVPHPGNDKKYYLFTVDMYIPPLFTDGVNYNIIDFTNNGYGEVTNKNTPLLSENAQKITGTLHENNHDYWVILHGFGAAKGTTFYAYLVSDTGLVTTPVISNIGSIHQGNDNNAAGYMKTSPDGSKIALLIPQEGIAEIFNFNRSTGQVTNVKSSGPGKFSYPFGLEFSPDNSKLYISTSPLGDGTNFLYQLDANAADPFASPYVVSQFDVAEVGAADSLMGAIQLGTDGKIYLSKFRRGVLGKTNLGVIYNPNRPQAACNFNRLNYVDNNGISLAGSEALIGLPNFVTSFLNIPHFTYYSQCHYDTTVFDITNRSNIDDTNWDFNDPDGDQISNDPYNPSFVFSEPGDYNVELTETFDGIEYPHIEQVRIHSLPFVDLGGGADTIYILPNSTIRLDAGDYDAYFWQPGGSNSRYYDVTQEGLYQVTVIDSNCCQNSDMVYVLYSSLSFPTAFNPKSSIAVNQVFKVIGNVTALQSYLLQVYNRWGQLIFESENPDEGWDGTYKGELVPGGTYIYSAVFKSYASDLQPQLEVKNRGVVTLVR